MNAEQTCAKVEQSGRWTFTIYIEDGPMRYGPRGYGWHRIGRGRAEAKACRELTRYLRRERWQREAYTVETRLTPRGELVVAVLIGVVLVGAMWGASALGYWLTKVPG